MPQKKNSFPLFSIFSPFVLSNHLIGEKHLAMSHGKKHFCVGLP
ncbi:hypothetical protein PPEP_b0952 [Pseudoalteromonas peptidolytica F12-50-A1]|uniref:Uncharacterized protein n=1 Tax=Pseudoalteromonas peptidolytica F12-50-A1 TaxID=1315280 RepID=A0A8I0T889_9GAMM|nr:hypothetical protein [Pseudoalteromonas peptidolytica F12-50-A1]